MLLLLVMLQLRVVGDASSRSLSIGALVLSAVGLCLVLLVSLILNLGRSPGVLAAPRSHRALPRASVEPMECG